MKNTTHERYVFRLTIQEDRSFDIFVTDLRRKAEYCNFGAIKDSLIRDQIAIKLCRITEQSQNQSKIFISPTTQTGSIDTVKKEEPPVDTAKSKNEDSRRIMKCKFCAASHDRGTKGSKPLEFYVLRDNGRPLFGFESSLDLELITLTNKVEQTGLRVDEVQEKFTLLDEFQYVFTGLGCVEGEYDINLKANSHPTIQPQRNAPLRLINSRKLSLILKGKRLLPK